MTEENYRMPAGFLWAAQLQPISLKADGKPTGRALALRTS